MTGRQVPEWHGATPDSKVPDNVRQRVFLNAGGICHIAQRKIRAGEPWELEHVIALADWTASGREGHGNRESNLLPALVDKHREKSSREATERADYRRKHAKHFGIKKPSGFRRHPTLKRTVSGQVVDR